MLRVLGNGSPVPQGCTIIHSPGLQRLIMANTCYFLPFRCGLQLHFPVANDFEYLLMCLLVICISLEKAVQIPYPLGCLFLVEW